jgi:hypothetical protein
MGQPVAVGDAADHDGAGLTTPVPVDDASVTADHGSAVAAFVGAGLFVALGALSLYRGLRAPEAHVRPLAEGLRQTTIALLLAGPGLMVLAPVGRKDLRLRGAALAGIVVTVLLVPLGIVAAVPTYLIWRGLPRRARTFRRSPRVAALAIAGAALAASVIVAFRRSGVSTCWVERVTAAAGHQYVVVASHNGVSGSSASGDVGGGCAYFSTVGNASIAMILALIGVAVVLLAAALPPRRADA